MGDIRELLERGAALPIGRPDVDGPYRRRHRTLSRGIALVTCAVVATALVVVVLQRNPSGLGSDEVRTLPGVGAPYSDDVNGFSIQIEPGWTRSSAPLRPWLASPREILSIATAPLVPSTGSGNQAACPSEVARVVVDGIGPGGAYLSLDQGGLGNTGTYEPRSARAADLTWNRGCPLPDGKRVEIASFHDAGRDLIATAVFGPQASTARRTEVYRMLDSLRFGNAELVPTAELRRPLRLPVVAPGEQCPITQGMSQPTPSLGTMLGDGPVRPVLTLDGHFQYATPEQSNAFPGSRWGGNKVLWAVGPSISGEVLIRGRRLDGHGDVRFGMAVDPAVEMILPSVAAGEPPDAAGWRDFASETRIRQPGCYAVQIDSASTSTIVVFTATPSI